MLLSTKEILLPLIAVILVIGPLWRIRGAAQETQLVAPLDGQGGECIIVAVELLEGSKVRCVDSCDDRSIGRATEDVEGAIDLHSSRG